ncbi:MAG: von Willebrand factor type [Myxococcales bacterium]|nr:von Willebrand factor type [Myxococcales bacterium]
MDAGLFGFVLDGLSAGAVAGLALAGAAALAGLYLLEPRRRAVVVAFAPLWFGDAGERRAERWARRLRRWLSLALQLAIFGLLLGAAAEPRPAVADRAGRSVVVLVDRSASMSAEDEPGTRLGAARTRARSALGAFGAQDRALVASFAADVVAESGFEPCTDTGLGVLARALLRVTATEERGDLPRALTFAAAALAGRPHPTIVLVTDGAFTEDARAQVGWSGDGSLAGVDVRWVSVGRRARNVAIVSFAARGLPADPTTAETAVSLRNFGDAPAAVTLEIASGGPASATEANVVERLSFTLAPGETRRHVVPDVAVPDARLEARLLEADDLALDNHAYAVSPRARRLRVLHVGARDLYLDGALLSLGDGIALERVSPESVERNRPRWRDYDAVLFDGVAPAPPPTQGHFLYLAPRGAGSPFPARGTVAAPAISDVRRGHPLLRQVDLADVNIAVADRLTLSAGDVAVAASFGVPLIVARERPGLRAVALAFDVRRSDLPMRPAFPLLLSNALSWLAGERARDAPPVNVGATARVPVPPGTKRVPVVDPTGARLEWPARGDVAQGAIAHAGFYVVGDVLLAANLADAHESDTTPARALVLGGRVLPPADTRSRRPAFALSTWALLAAATLLLFEWVSTNRRWTV